MSLYTWRREFYPQGLSKFKKRKNINRKVIISALKHSILKWKGLLSSNLKKHNVIFIAGKVDNTPFSTSSQPVIIDYRSCSLCKLFYEKCSIGCGKCPLYVIRKGYSCDTMSSRGSEPYEDMMHQDNPRPMIKLLEKTLKYYLENRDCKDVRSVG